MLSSRSFLGSSNILLGSAATVIIIFTIVITAAVQDANEKSFSHVITVGPVWTSDAWICTSDAEFIVHAVLIAYTEFNSLTISISSQGIQPDFVLTTLEMESFSIGAKSGDTITISRTGNITGYITLQTTSGATASCKQI